MEQIKKRRELDLTQGPLFTRILLFILPLMASNLLQTLYNAADMMVVSLSSEANSVGAIGFTGPFINMITNIFIGFSAGATVWWQGTLAPRMTRAFPTRFTPQLP